MGICDNVDIVPRVLVRLGIAIPSYTDGRVLPLPTIDSSKGIKEIDYRPVWRIKRAAFHKVRKSIE